MRCDKFVVLRLLDFSEREFDFVFDARLRKLFSVNHFNISLRKLSFQVFGGFDSLNFHFGLVEPKESSIEMNQKNFCVVLEKLLNLNVQCLKRLWNSNHNKRWKRWKANEKTQKGNFIWENNFPRASSFIQFKKFKNW